MDEMRKFRLTWSDGFVEFVVACHLTMAGFLSKHQKAYIAENNKGLYLREGVVVDYITEKEL